MIYLKMVLEYSIIMKLFFRITSYILLIAIFFSFWYIAFVFHTGKWFIEYRNLYEYRRLHPELLPSSETIRMVDMGHHFSYASLSWIKFIQFVGDNVGNGEYLNFSHTILKSITELNPYFARGYEIDLLFTPLARLDLTPEETKKNAVLFERSIDHGKIWVQVLCDSKKLQEIDSIPIGNDLWKRDDLKNPCVSGMIPYYMALIYGNSLKDGIQAERYYKIASMNEKDVPEASKFLWILARSSGGNYRDSATTFFLVWQSGYDPAPYQCRQVSQMIARDLMSGTEIPLSMIQSLQKIETSIQDTRDEKNPESLSVTNCVDSLRRGTKQIYLAYIDQVSRPYPEIQDANELVQKKIIPSVPFLKDQSSGFTLLKKDGVWNYRLIIK
jgi:hypothetical protein